MKGRNLGMLFLGGGGGVGGFISGVGSLFGGGGGSISSSGVKGEIKSGKIKSVLVSFL